MATGRRPPPAAFHTLTVAAVEPAHRRRGRGHLRRARRPGRRVRVRGRPVADPAPDRRRRASSAARTRSARPPGQRPRVGVREIPDGLFSRWLVHEVAPRRPRSRCRRPSGTLPRRPRAARGRPAPVHRRRLRASPRCCRSPRTRARRTPTREVTLLYGNRTTGSVMFAEELADLKNRYGPRLQLVHVLSREPRDVELFSGRLDADRLRRLLTALVPAAALRPRVAVRTARDARRRPRRCSPSSASPTDRVHFELFYVDEPPPELHRADAGSAARPAR